MTTVQTGSAGVVETLRGAINALMAALQTGDLDALERIVERQGALVAALRSLMGADNDLREALQQLAVLNRDAGLVLARHMAVVDEEMSYVQRLSTLNAG